MLLLMVLDISYYLHMPPMTKAPVNGATLRSLRIRSGFTQSQLSERAGVAQSHISAIENGEHPSELAALRLAKALGVPLRRLVRRSR